MFVRERLVKFREEIRDFLDLNLSEELRRRTRDKTFSSRRDIEEWTKVLHQHGWSVPGWPVEYGGTGWSRIEEELFYIEQTMADAPEMSPFGTFMIGPVLIEFGTPWQKSRYLSKIRDGSEFWCQGFSEPNAGSDLASLQTKAERRDGRYVVNGQKIWTSTAHFADYMFCLVRTMSSTVKQHGISMLLIDMMAPGVTISPIITMDGNHYLNQVFFDNVEVEDRNLIGEEGLGWRYAKFLLERERISSAFLPKIKSDILKLRALYAKIYGERDDTSHAKLLDQRIAKLECAAMAHEATVYRILNNEIAIDGLSAAAMVKIVGADLHKDISELMVDLLGPEGIVKEGDLLKHEDLNKPFIAVGVGGEYCMGRAFSIFGGTNEIQRNIIAKNGLGL